MAVFHHLQAGSRISYNGGSIGEEQLPTGSCNYKDLSNGATAPVCGCRRFWLSRNRLGGRHEVSDTAWCFCGHHACFHYAVSPQQSQTSQQSDRNQGHPHAGTGLDAPAVPPSNAPQQKPEGLGIRNGSAPRQQSINTRLWDALNGFARQQADGPTSDAGSSKLPSTAVPSLVGDARPSPTRIMQQRAHLSRSMGPPVTIPSAYMMRPGADEYSATEVATPSAQGTPDCRTFQPGPQTRTSPALAQPFQRRATASPVVHARPTTEVEQPSTSQALPNHASPPAAGPSARRMFNAQEVGDLLQAYGHRIEVLENLSFSHVPIEEIQDKFENFDGRILDLEHWRTDHERECTSPEPVQPESSNKRRLLPTDSSSFASDGSFDSAAAAQTEAAVLATLAANSETVPRLDALESRVAELEGESMPSFARPWHVEVVLLPWGEDLRGIWFSALESTQHSLKSSQLAADEWTGAQSTPKLSFQSAASGAWTTESIQAWANETHEWMSPKACGPSGMVYQRLASRGLVQDISLTSSDSRHILSTLAATFDGILESSGTEETKQTQRFQGLRESLVPLRKVRKSARLRFLTPAEMITSANWTADFLDASVMMKVNDGQRRLYLTTPDAYLQSGEGGWTWPEIRRLPMFDATGEEQAAQATSTVIEACWTYNDRLDHLPSAHTSFASQDSHWSPKSQQPHGVEATGDVQPLSPSSEARPIRQRTLSLPSSNYAPEQARDIAPKRRVASFETGTTTLPLSQQPIVEGTTGKRRRITSSPEAERRGVGLTPRWSREPPSPFASDRVGEARSQATSSRPRGTTPFAYATPHSNMNYVGCADLFMGDGDTEADDTDMLQPQSEHDGEEWHGVEDDKEAEEYRYAAESELSEADVDEDLPDDVGDEV